MSAARTPVIGYLIRYAAGLRFPTLFAIVATLFLLDLLVPDAIPFADELLLGLVTLLLGSLKQRKHRPQSSDRRA